MIFDRFTKTFHCYSLLFAILFFLYFGGQLRRALSPPKPEPEAIRCIIISYPSSSFIKLNGNSKISSAMPCLMLDEASNGPVAGFLHDKRPDAMACLDTRNIAWTYHPPRIAMHRRSCCHCYGRHSSAFVRLPVRNSVGIFRSFICSETC